MKNNELMNILQSKKTIIDKALNNLIPNTDQPWNDIQKAMRYSVLAPGKRIRPTLCLLTLEIFQPVKEVFVNIACALELLHVYTLIHDDLPCMDDDDLRRGQPTLHKVFPESIALLAGDALLTKCFEVISYNSSLFPATGINIIQDLAVLAGENGVIGGQVLDIISENSEIDYNHLKLIHHNKTAKLIMASVRIGAMLAQADSSALEKLTEYGRAIGHAFQIRDDILDETGDEKKMGKKPGQDKKLNKATYPKLFGLEKSRLLLKDEIQKAIESLQNLGSNAMPLQLIAEYIASREN